MKKLLYQEILEKRKTIETIHQTQRHPITLILHNIRSAYNVGSIFRTGDSALVEQIILCGFTPHPPNNEIAKTSLGAIESVPWSYEKDIIKTIKNEKANGKKVFAVELTDCSLPYSSLTKDNYPLCLILGNEISGVDDYVLEHCDGALDIPMYGIKHSLNVSVAAGIVVYEAVKIWINNKI